MANNFRMGFGGGNGRLKSYEKYDKSHDDIIICNACSTVCDIGDDFCPHCGCSLLK